MAEPCLRTDDDDREFAAFLEGMRSRVAAFLRRLAGHDRIEDVMQETFERVWRYRGSWRREGNPGAWLLRSAFHVFVDQRRRERNRPLPLDEVAPVAAPSRECPAEVREELELCMQRMTRLERDLLLGFHRDGLSLKELAARHRLPVNTVKSHLHRARRKLPGGQE